MPKKICNEISCNTLIPMSERYCAAHKRDNIQRRNSHYDKNFRNKKHQIFYSSSEWRKIRKIVMIKAGGLCASCMDMNIVTNADVVDHIVPITIDYTKRLEESNLQPLCHTCHNKKTADDELCNRRGA